MSIARFTLLLGLACAVAGCMDPQYASLYGRPQPKPTPVVAAPAPPPVPPGEMTPPLAAPRGAVATESLFQAPPPHPALPASTGLPPVQSHGRPTGSARSPAPAVAAPAALLIPVKESRGLRNGAKRRFEADIQALDRAARDSRRTDDLPLRFTLLYMRLTSQLQAEDPGAVDAVARLRQPILAGLARGARS